MPLNLERLSKLTADDTVKQMLLALPDFSVGDQVHAIYVNRLKGATPGRHSRFVGKGDRFIDIFFPGWSAVRFEPDVSRLTGLDDGFWSGFAVAVLCQSMDALTKQLRPQLKHDDINNAVASHNQSLRSSSAAFYSQVFSQVFTDFSVPLGKVDKNTARAQYIQALKDGVNVHALWYSEGQWKNPDWEMFHHYIKLLALGSSPQEIDVLIGQLKSLGLPVPASVSQNAWRSYTFYLQNHPQLDHGDIDAAARDGILRSEYMPSPRGPGSSMAEENSFEFTANGQPGSGFRKVPSGGSCFSRGTLVLMEDLSLKPIEQVRSGDRVASPLGTREVAFVSTPLRGGRTLYSLNGQAFSFTGTHPFRSGVQAETGTQLLAVDPEGLDHWVPTLSHAGVGALEVGTQVVGVKQDAPSRTEPVRVQTLTKHEAGGDDDELLYDLILTPDATGGFPYVVGTREGLFAVASELPILSRVPHAAVAVLELLKEVLPALRRHAQGTSRAGYLAFLERLRRRITTGLLHEALSGGALPDAAGAALLGGSLESHVAGAMRAFVTAEGGYDWVAGGFYEMFASAMAEELEAAIQHPHRQFQAGPGKRLAVTVHELRLHPSRELGPMGALRLVLKPMVEGRAVEVHTLDDRGGRANTRFVRHFDRGLLLEPRWEKRLPEKLLFELYPAFKDRPLCSAEAHLPDTLSPPYKHLRARVHAMDGREAGELFADVRLLSEERAMQEHELAGRQDAGTRLRFAFALGRRMGAVLTDWLTAGHVTRQS